MEFEYLGLQCQGLGGSFERNKGSPVELKVFGIVNYIFMSSFQCGQPRCCPLFKTCNERNKYYWVQRFREKAWGLGMEAMGGNGSPRRDR
jgi:hypothetical protein